MPKGVINSPAGGFRVAGADRYAVAQLARKYTLPAIKKLVDLMNGNAGTMKVLNKDGVLIEIPIEVPAAVQGKCAEILLDRGHGRPTQAHTLEGIEGRLPIGERALSIAERIVALQQARDQLGKTRDLEANDQQEIEAEIIPTPTLMPAPTQEDFI